MPLKTLLRRFATDGSGNVAIICAAAILPILVIAGGATDIARHEAYRVQLQDGVDRAVLAAASLTQTRPVKQTVDDYLKSVSFIDKVTLAIDQKTQLNQRSVTVTATYPMDTAFLPLIGITMIPVSATATAVERRKNVEMSLMLDISGSMEGSKYTNLKSAATTFVRTMLPTEARPTTSISIVPYAGQVNVGEAVFNGLGGLRAHNNSSCFNLNKLDYASGWRVFAGRSQVPHFTRWNGTAERATLPANMNPGWCPSEDTSISYLSNDPDYLAARIAGYKMYDGTGSAIAMNYGLMLLDPTAQPMVAMATLAGMVPSGFANRPAPYGDGDTIKVLVLMTDGAITEQYTAKDPSKPVRTSNNYLDYYDPLTGVKETSSVTKGYLAKVCATAKDKGVMVFTIGFQLRDSVASELAMKNELRACSTSPSHYYDVTGLDIASAFQSIATSIEKIKLTQ